MLRFRGRLGRSSCARSQGEARPSRRGWRPCAEGLEGRALLTAVPGGDYTLSGYQWANPSQITYSIAPDGVQWDHGTNVLNATFDAKFGAGTWERAIAEALASWESVANINIAQVADSPLPYDTIGQSQGDPRFGDIRIGGYAFLNNTTTLARTVFPPPNGNTAAGDIEINTAMNFNLGASYDLYSVLLHETGHSLGLNHATDPAEVMYADYQGIRTGLAPGDIAGIQALYGPRTADAYQQQGEGLGFSSAIDLTAGLDAAHQVTLGNPSLATIGDTEYFSVVAPAVSGATLQVTATAGGVSLLSPQVSLFDANGQALDVAGNAGAWGDNVTAQFAQVVPGQRYYIAVTGATSDVFAVGAYQLHVAFAGGSAPTQSPPATTTLPVATPPPTPTPLPPVPSTTIADTSAVTSPPPIAPDRFEPNDTPSQASPLGTISATTVEGLSLHNAGDVDDFSFRVARAGLYQVQASGTSIRVLDGFGNTLAVGAGQVTFRSLRARTPFTVEISAADGRPVASYALAIAPPAPVRPARLPKVGLGVHPRPPALHRLFIPRPAAHHMPLRIHHR